MDKSLLIIFLTFATIVFANDKEIQIPFSEENAKYWQYISDQTMGGVSNGQAVLEKDEEKFFARVISGFLLVGSSFGKFLYTIFELVFIKLFRILTNSKIVISFVFPKFTGFKYDESINLIIPSIKSST